MSVKKNTPEEKQALKDWLESDEYKQQLDELARKVRPGSAVEKTSSDRKRSARTRKNKKDRRLKRKPISAETMAFCERKGVVVPPNATGKTIQKWIDAWRKEAAKRAREAYVKKREKRVIVRRANDEKPPILQE